MKINKIYCLSTLLFLHFLLTASPAAFAAGKVLAPPTNQSAVPIGGADASANIVPIRVTSGGMMILSSSGSAGTSTNGAVNVSASGATDRTQLTSVATNYCSFQAPQGNTGAVYVGGSTVTNASGANEGIRLNQGDIFGPILMTANLNEMYVAADTTNDDLKYFCK